MRRYDSNRETAVAAMANAVLEQETFAASLFDALQQGTGRGRGICRDAYGAGENFAHCLLAKTGRDLGFLVDQDAAANTYVTFAGRDRMQPRVIVGSHLIFVADGGNFDGAAGVVAGLTAIKALRESGFAPRCDITVMGVRAEDVWFTTTFFGSSAALGKLAPDVLERTRVDTGKTLSEHLRGCGGDPDRLRSGEPYLTPSNVAAFLELHIEQGPVLEASSFPSGSSPAYAATGGFPQRASSANTTTAAACRAAGATTASWPAPISSMPWMRSGANGTRPAGTWHSPSANSSPTRNNMP